MGYERNDRRFGGSYGNDRTYGGYDQDRNRSTGGYGRDAYNQGGSRDYRGDRFDDRPDDNRYGRDYGQDPRGYEYQDRGFFDRAGDEVRSWFGDEDAERRRRADERNAPRDTGGYGYDEAGSGYRNRGNSGQHFDPSYRSWRDRQIEALDRDYHDYRRENQSKFDNEFHGWRQNRQGQRDLLQKVQEHQEVVGSDGQHVGTVDHVRGDRIRLAKNDQAAGGHHHSIPSSWIQSVDDKVTISKTADQAKAHWREEADREEQSAFFGSDRNLNRSFSGTY
ncbi:hypothetical protein FHS31_002315 [Sphingomonas vulcanisoli]|uniref:DUF2171 domain-containing protein n=1 Tax=Sphingomonas vulcanisoli TaxID=1658060 RepID=A0ABX0TT55_9SPHN|nr:DUF2171 domain-containing protein [Sphingomonas vulcanisoli]NIJ08694.1 hypothetical protein [Sphingomonas vulcanisoli]